MHVLCTDHHSGKCYAAGAGPGGARHASNLSCVAHFTTSADLSVWTLRERINLRPALEPTFAYLGPVGNAAVVSFAHFVWLPKPWSPALDDAIHSVQAAITGGYRTGHSFIALATPRWANAWRRVHLLHRFER